MVDEDGVFGVQPLLVLLSSAVVVKQCVLTTLASLTGWG